LPKISKKKYIKRKKYGLFPLIQVPKICVTEVSTYKLDVKKDDDFVIKKYLSKVKKTKK